MASVSLSFVALRTVLVLAGVAASQPVLACEPVDFLAIELPAEADEPVETALELAYPGLQVGGDPREVRLSGASAIPLGSVRDIAPQDMLLEPAITEQFIYPYPLAFDLGPRRMPFHDPGRLRNPALFEMLYFSEADAARASLRTIPFGPLGDGAFQVTRRHGVDCQLEAVLAELGTAADTYKAFFRSPGGSFNWRRIAGTDRLSAHSFGIAVDLNVELGGYWRWSGAREGDVGPYHNRMPADLVTAFERYGFIWGGKWHHYDGMHFEYRPELILYSRLLDEGN